MMAATYGYKAYDQTIHEEVYIHIPKECILGEIVEVKFPDSIHDCKVLGKLAEDSDCEMDGR